jgi:hypothetical protein
MTQTQTKAALHPLCTLPNPAQLVSIPDGDDLVLVEYLITDGFAVLSVEGVAAWYDQTKPCAKDDHAISVNRRDLQAAFRQLAEDGLPVTVSAEESALHLVSARRQVVVGTGEALEPAAPESAAADTPALPYFLEALKRGQSAVDNGLMLAVVTGLQEQTVFHFSPSALAVYRVREGNTLNRREFPPMPFSQLLEALCHAK